MFAESDLKQVLDLALAKGGDFADIFIERKETTGISCEANQIERVISGVDLGAGIRVLSGDKTSYAYTNDVSLPGLKQVAELVAQGVQGEKRDVTIKLTKAQPESDFKAAKRPDRVGIADKVGVVEAANKRAWQVDDRVKQVSVGYGDVIQQVTIANSEGIFVEDERIRTRLTVNVVAAEGGVIQTGYNALGGTVGFEIFHQTAPEVLAEASAKRAVLMLGAKPAPSGKMPVVMASEAGGTMVHEACGHGLEADLCQKQLSVYAGKIGEKVASDLVTVIDDGTIPGKYGSLRYDDEGTPSRKNVLIDGGVLTGYMYDYITAAKDKAQRSGNGRRESYQDKPIPRMTNTYIAPGKTEPEEIIKEVKNGLLVKKMGGGQVNTINGDFVFDVAEGYLIKDGEIGPAVRGATLTGNGPESLQKVRMVGKDLGFEIGTCGKDGQGVPVSDAQPTIMIEELIVGGTEIAGEGSPQIKTIRRL